ncbi:hypothetical protein K439DRAFT_871400 [Ramaria rubella]|nr:hypothetical protein K439DRAFT_871400 [Ramaria rubella]
MASRSRRVQKPKTSKSSLVSHTFPPFYACYLLKSVKHPKSITTYIGSTPHPPRRIRQHNGEITQGAWKTSRNRPWVVSMIVHGFPSKLAALQFEWAWQHPNLSRHLRGEEMAKGRSLKGNIAVGRSMLTTHPYTTWPLHVKLFTPEAVKGWADACKDSTPLPPGLTVSVELEGVDGKRDDVGSGRNGPIDVTDKTFTSEHLAKHMAMLATGKTQKCTICESDLDLQTIDTLSLALCPTSDCTAYSHLTCLAASFLNLSGASSSDEPPLIPRGGTCKACQKYTLWGDVVRGCYRRRTGGPGTALEQSAIIEEAEGESDSDGGEIFGDGPEDAPHVSPGKRKIQPAKTARTESKAAAKGKKKQVQIAPSNEESEFFNLNAIPGSSSTPSHFASRMPVSKKAKAPPRPRGRPPGSRSKPKPVVQPCVGVSGEFFDIDEFSSSESDPVPTVSRRRKSRARSDTELTDAIASMRIRHSSDVDMPSQDRQPSSPRGTLRGLPRGVPARHLDDDPDTVIEISD